jgi:hypothetical protein
MAQAGMILRALIASPGDVQEERDAIADVLTTWNATHSLRRAIIIEPVRWESHAVPGLEGRPQEMINNQLLTQCDFLIGVFWTRIGTSTGVALSGTVEEIQEFRAAGKPVLLYFSMQPANLHYVDRSQYENLCKFRLKIRKEGLVEDYHDVSDLREKLSRHINSVVDRIIPAESVPIVMFAKEGKELDVLSEARRRNQILASLRSKYILAHDHLPDTILSGLEAPPRGWIESELKRMGETWWTYNDQ